MRSKTKLQCLILVVLVLLIWAGSAHAVVGNPMVVAATASNTISHWTWNAGTWSSASTISITKTMTHVRMDVAVVEYFFLKELEESQNSDL